MKFENKTKENVKYRVGTYNTGFDWHTIRPGEIQVIPEEVGMNLPLIEVKDEIKKEENPKDVEKTLPKATKKKDPKKIKKGLFNFKGSKKSTKKSK